MTTDLGNAFFTWKGDDYPCNASITTFTRQLEHGGFDLDRQLNALSSIDLFSDVIPQPQDLLSFSDDDYRIISFKKDPTGAYYEVVAMGISRGV